VNNGKNENIDMFNDIVKQVNILASKKNKLEIEKKDIILMLKELEENIVNSKISRIEKIIEYITFGIINYKNKYKENILGYRESIKKINSNVIDKDLKAINAEILRFKKKLETQLNMFKNKLLEFQNYLLSVSKTQYINNYKNEEFKKELNALILNKEEFLLHENIKGEIGELLNFQEEPKSWVEEKNILFIKKEKRKEKTFLDTIESNPLTDKQQEAVLTNENNNLVLAGAGSGKTSVIVAKVAYLIKKKILHPSEILVLAFNINAKEELEERFIKHDIKVKVKTFHSFGSSIIAEALSQKLLLCPMTEDPQKMTNFIKDTIKELTVSREGFLEKFLVFMTYFKMPYKNESEFNTLGEYYDYQKSHNMKTLKHEVIEKGKKQGKNLITLKEETVKSHQELVIANFLTIHGIKYLYEEPYEHKTATLEKRQYQPDFFLPEYGIYIEHFGIDRNNKTAPYVDNKEYLKGIKWKEALHAEHNTPLIQTFSYEFSENNLLELLKEKLLRHNVAFRELELAEITELLKKPIENNEFTKLFTTFLAHYKSNRHSLEKLNGNSEKTERTQLFLKLFEFIFTEYKKYQKSNSCIDFDDMIVDALNSIEKSEFTHNFKHIFIDEFQDISTTRAKLIKSLLPINNTSITAVGDDWQSINRFAGSNIQIIQDFQEIFGTSKTVALDYTFRFNNVVSELASRFIQKNPHQIKKDIKTIKHQDSDKFSILLYWTTGDNKVDLKHILNLISKKEKDEKKSIMVLVRYKFIYKDLEGLGNIYSNLDITFSSVHGSKGNEADYVIILNINKGEFGFPSKIVDDPILDLVIPEGDDYEDAEERRLFYVALTRTKSRIFLLSDMYNKSPFIEELIDDNKHEIYFLNDSKIELENCSECKTGFLKKRVDPKNKDKYFYGCSNYPRCKFTENVYYCPECNNEVLKDIKNGIGECSSDDCDFESSLCIKCNGYMITRQGKHGKFLGCKNYPKCNYTVKLN